MPGPLLILLLLAALPLLGLAAAGILLRLGLRGRRINNHPICRKCGYDLFGSVGDHCPECGNDLTDESSYVIGRRERRRGVMRLGFAVALVSALGGIAVGRIIVQGLTEIGVRPTWWLVRDLAAKPGPAQNQALGELARRLARDDLSPADVRRAVDGVLAWQEDSVVFWNVAWGDFVESARVKGLVAEDQWARYVRQGVVFWLHTRPVVRQGDDPQFRLKFGPHRFGAQAGLTVDYTVTFTIDGRPHPTPVRYSRRFDWGTRWWTTGPLPLPNDLPGGGAIGQHTVTAHFDMTVSEAPTRRPPGATDAVRWQRSLSSRFRLVPATEPTVELVHDPDLLAAVRESLKLREVVAPTNGNTLQVRLVAGKSVPLDLACDVVIRAGDREWLARGAIMNATAAGDMTAIATLTQPFDATHVDLIVRGSVATAVATTDIVRIWGGEVVFKDVPVTPSDAMGVPKPLISPTTQPR